MNRLNHYSIRRSFIPTNQNELNGFYSVGVAMAALSQGMATFFPLIIDNETTRISFLKPNGTSTTNNTGVVEGITGGNRTACSNLDPFECFIPVSLGGGRTSAISRGVLIFSLIAIASFLQILMTLALGAHADYGSKRQYYLKLFSYTSCALAILLVFVQNVLVIVLIIFVVLSDKINNITSMVIT